MKRIAAISALFLISISSTLAGWREKPTIADEYAKSDVVFMGTVIRCRKIFDSDDLITGVFYSLRVDQPVKACHESIVEIYSENDSGRFYMEKGRKYYIFAYHRDTPEIRDYLMVYPYGNSEEIRIRKKKLRK